MKNLKLYNVFFPVWLLILIPFTWVIAIPVNFIVDSLVIFISLKFLKIEEAFQKYKKVIFKVFIFGFLSDFIGSVFLILVTYLGTIGGELSAFTKWFEKNIVSYMMSNPIANIYAFTIVALAVLLAGICIYFFNLKISFKNLDIDEKDKRKMALIMAIFTAPYLFFLPVSLIYSGYAM